MERDRVKQLVKSGINPRPSPGAPSADNVTGEELPPLTWGQLWAQWYDINSTERDEHWTANLRSQWKCHLSPSIGDLPLPDATRKPLLDHYENEKKAGREYTARRALALMQRLVKYAIKEGLPENHELTRLALPDKPIKQVQESQKPEKFDIDDFLAAHGEDAIGNDHELDKAGRALQFSELVTLLRDMLPNSCQSETGKCIIRLMLATGIRAKEVVGIRWRWISLERKLMILPAGGMKKRRMHHVHLSEYAIKQIKAMENAKTNDFVFPAPKKKDASVRRDNVGTDIRLRQHYPQMGESEEEAAARLAARMQIRRFKHEYNLYNLPGGPWTLYDLRRTAATRLEELGYEHDMVGVVLAHAQQDTVTERYTRFSHWERRCEVLDALGTALEACEAGILPEA